MAKKEIVTTIPELVQKMKDINIAVYAIFESWVRKFNDGKYDKFEFYERIAGFIWGLYSTGFLLDDEKDCLLKHLYTYLD